MLSMVAASTAATAQATARSRTRAASTSRRSGSRSLLSFKPRTGRSGERITAAATTAPNSAPRPTSSTPATAWNPRARNSRSRVASHRNLPPAARGRMARSRLIALFKTGGLALQSAQVVQLGAADAAGSDHVDVIHHLGVHRKNALHSLAEADLPDRDAFAHPRAIAGDEGAFKRLEPFLVAFLNLDVHLNGVAGTKRREGLFPLVLVGILLHQRILHGIS